jgi:hypothetical protein
VKRNVFLLTLMMLVAVLSFAPVIAQANSCTPVRIWKYPYCSNPENDPDDIYWSKNPENTFTGEKYYWWIAINVTAYTDLSNVRVYDRLGAELMIEGICIDTPKYEPYDYNFTYAPYELNGAVDVDGVSGWLNKDGVTFGSEPFEFEIYWTGNSVKAHFQWNIGSMSVGQTRTIFLVVSTDTNPAGHQEYTSCGNYWLNSGATLKAIVDSTGKQFSAETNGIQIHVECPPCEA